MHFYLSLQIEIRWKMYMLLKHQTSLFQAHYSRSVFLINSCVSEGEKTSFSADCVQYVCTCDYTWLHCRGGGRSRDIKDDTVRVYSGSRTEQGWITHMPTQSTSPRYTLKDAALGRSERLLLLNAHLLYDGCWQKSAALVKWKTHCFVSWVSRLRLFFSSQCSTVQPWLFRAPAVWTPCPTWSCSGWRRSWRGRGTRPRGHVSGRRS